MDSDTTQPAKPATDDVLKQVFFTLEVMDERLSEIENNIVGLAGPLQYHKSAYQRLQAQYEELKSLLYIARLYIPSDEEGGDPDSATLRYCIDQALESTIRSKEAYQQACEDARRGLIPGVVPNPTPT